MTFDKQMLRETMSSFYWTVALTLLFVFYNSNPDVLPGMLIALPFFMVFYFILFSIGREKVSAGLRKWSGSAIGKILAVPAALIILYFGYLLLNQQNPFRGVVSMVPYLVFFPVLVFAAGRKHGTRIDWLDFVTFVVFLLPITLINAKPSGNLPVSGNSFDSVYRIVMMLTAVYAFVVVRGLDDVGFFPEFKWKSLFTSVWVWLAFYVFVFIIGYSVDFIRIKGHEVFDFPLVKKIVLVFITTFLHTALFEELFFRGILQNILEKRIRRAKNRMAFWKWGLGVLFLLSILVGYTLKGSMQWFPALVTLLIFLAAFFIEKSGRFSAGTYTSLAITGVIFGLVHYHSGSIIFIGFASIAGWAYGYTWLKTRNVFYAALVHTLVNSSALMFGLELAK
jgi:membrane protease YdiL (CAAX protease family)